MSFVRNPSQFYFLWYYATTKTNPNLQNIPSLWVTFPICTKNLNHFRQTGLNFCGTFLYLFQWRAGIFICHGDFRSQIMPILSAKSRKGSENQGLRPVFHIKIKQEPKMRIGTFGKENSLISSIIIIIQYVPFKKHLFWILRNSDFLWLFLLKIMLKKENRN